MIFLICFVSCRSKQFFIEKPHMWRFVFQSYRWRGYFMWLDSVLEVWDTMLSLSKKSLSHITISDRHICTCPFRQDLFVILRDFSGLVQILIPQDEVAIRFYCLFCFWSFNSGAATNICWLICCSNMFLPLLYIFLWHFISLVQIWIEECFSWSHCGVRRHG